MTGDPELREPDLPRTAKVRKQALRTGWTTGTCASAAAKAATTALDTGEMQDSVEVGLPDVARAGPISTSVCFQSLRSLMVAASWSSVVWMISSSGQVTW